MKVALLCLLVFTGSFLGCNKEATHLKISSHGYFTMQHQNHAWSYQHYGWIINKDGIAMSFNMPSKWNYEDSLGYISESKLLENLSYCNKQIAHVSKHALYKNNSMIEDASKRTGSLKPGTTKDGGISQYSCYLYDSSKYLYKKVTVKAEGDLTYINESNEAKQIYEWMKGI